MSYGQNQLRTFETFSSKDTVRKLKCKPQTERKYMQNIHSTKDLYLEYIKNTYKQIIRNNPILKNQ